MPDFLRNGVRSTKACELQNSPTLSVVNDDTTSGALGPPARRAWLILSSVMLLTALTVMLGWIFSNAAMLFLIAFTSFGALQPCQNVMVVLAFGSSFAPLPLDPPHALVALRTRAKVAVAAARRRRCRDVGMGFLLRVRAQVVTERADGFCKVSKTCSRVAASAVWSAPVSTGSSDTADGSTSGSATGSAASSGP